MPTALETAIYGLTWVSFGAGHSVLALASVKDRVSSRLRPHYRLVYNVLATLHLGAMLGVGWWLLGGYPNYATGTLFGTIQLAATLAGVVVMVVASRGYDLGRLSGLKQIRCARAGLELPEDEPLRRDGLHRFVRHPIYAGGFLFLWGRAVDPLGLHTAIWGSVYLIVGIVLEERKLVHLYGDAYRDYRRRVPAVLPWRGQAV